VPLQRENVGVDGVEVHTERQGCPPHHEVILFVARMMGATEAAAFSQHVDSCESCRSRVAALGATPGMEQVSALPGSASLEPVATIGQRLGRFTLTRLLGRGGMGEVWAARDPELEREVAIKLLYVDFGGMDHERQARLRREAQAMARVNHPNIVRIYELGADGDRLFCAMELVEGETLRHWLETQRPWRETLDVLLAAGRGVAAAHAAGLVHRDVKPDNVMIARDGRILVGDFGLAKLAGMGAEPPPAAGSVRLDPGANVSLTTTGSFLGTPMYMAPEVLEAREGDALSDQFSFCVMAYEALYRSRPFRGTTLGELVESVYEEPAPPVPGRKAPPRGLWRCIRRGLTVAKDGRWPTMAPLLAGLERAAAAPRRRRVGIAAAAVVALTASSVVVLASPEPDQEALVREASESRMGAVWSPARRDGMRTAFARAGEPAVAAMAASTTGALDRYRDAWQAMRIDAWRATNLRHEQSARLLELRMRCLDRLADEMDAFLQIAADAGRADQLRRIGEGVGRLTPVATCADEGKMAAVFPATIDDDRPDLRKKFDIEEARMRAAIAAMPPADAIKAIQVAIADAERTRVPGLSSGFLFLLAVVQNEAGDIKGAEATLRKLIQEAARARRHFMVAAGWLRLIQSLASKQLRMDEAIALEPTARAAVAQAGDEPRLRAELATTLGGIAWQKGDLAEARDRFLEARDVMVAAFGPKDEVAAGSEVSLAMALFQLKELDEAARRAQHAYQVLHEKGIDSDRSAGKALMVLAWVARERKDWEAAARHSKASIAEMARLHGTDNLELAFSRRELGHALSELERHDEAIEQMKMCVDVFSRVGPTHPDTLVARLELGKIYEKAKRYVDAEKIDRETVKALREGGKSSRDHLGSGLLELGRVVAYRSPAEAVPLYDEGMRIYMKRSDVKDEERVEVLQEVSKVALAAGKAKWMLAWLDRVPGAAAKLPALRKKLVKASRRRHARGSPTSPNRRSRP
jgi:tetratricopeptide (TPR) repeat protein